LENPKLNFALHSFRIADMIFTLVSTILLAGTTVLAQTTPEGFAPSANATLDVYYGTTYVSPGAMIKKSVTQKAPVIGATGTALTGKYLLALIDLDVPGALLGGPAGSRLTNLHALLQDYTASGTTQNGTATLTTKSTTPAAYQGPAPPSENPAHPHKYVFLLFKQPDNFAVPSSQKSAVQQRMRFNITTFVKDAGLAAPVAGNWLQVQSGDNTL
jgi:phosphatidylethanolamine-binding protein (PEBP) family uncharacterized protein